MRDVIDRLGSAVRLALPLIAVAGIAGGLVASGQGRPDLAQLVWAIAIVPVLAALVVEIVTSLRRGDVGLDIVAALSMSGALLIGEMLAGAVVALMYAGGQFLEDYARGRARREMSALLARVPRTALRHRDGGIEEVPLSAIRAGDRLLVRPGDVVPADGRLAGAAATLDLSALTGESLPVAVVAGERVMSGATNSGAAFDLEATETAERSTYARIVALVESAQASKAPMVRLADRWAIGFLVITVAMALAAWLVSGDPRRALAVLVVATPCPLILAVPVAIVSGISVAAKRGILVKHGGALETLGRAAVVLFDKTGTVTRGESRVAAIDVEPGFDPDEVLRLAASLAQASSHVVSRALVAEARQRGLALMPPSSAVEEAGAGVSGHVAGRRVALGSHAFLASRTQLNDSARRIVSRADAGGGVGLFIGIDDVAAGAVLLSDPAREEAAAALGRLRAMGVDRIAMVTGDRADIARSIAAGLPIDAVIADTLPKDKVEAVLRERDRGPVVMVGDGVNDAPALAAADVGVAMGARGAAASAEAADVVLLVDDLTRVPDAVSIARRSRRIAVESVAVGLGLSFIGMVAAALGFLPPLAGALTQEAIDVAVVLNALRALRWRPS